MLQNLVLRPERQCDDKMVKLHLKRISAPKTWHIDRKENKFVTRPLPGAHSLEYGMSLSLAMRELMKVAKTSKEVKQIIKIKDVFVDKRKRVDKKVPVGLMDVVEFPQIEEQYRMLLDSKGRLTAVPIDKKESSVKISRIENKTKIAGGKVQLNMFDGRNIIIDDDSYKVGDTLEFSLPDQKIKTHLKFDKGASILLIAGKHKGSIGKVEEVLGNKILIKSGKDKFETLKRYAFVIGQDKPLYSCFKTLSEKKK